jgi:hypothetical protein
MPPAARLVLALVLLLPAACNRKKAADTGKGGDTDNDGLAGLLGGGGGKPAADRDRKKPTKEQDLAKLREERPMPAFAALAVGIGSDVTVTIGSKHAVTVDAPDDVLPLIETAVVDGVLHVGLIPNEVIAGSPKIRFKVVTPRLEGVATGIHGRVTVPKMSGDTVTLDAGVKGTITVDSIAARKLVLTRGIDGTVTATGKADAVVVGDVGRVDLKGTFGTVDATLSGGGGRVRLSGTITTLKADVSSVGKLEVSGQVAGATVKASSAADVRLSGTLGTVSTSLEGSAAVTLTGTARSLTAAVTSDGKLDAAGLEAEAVDVTVRTHNVVTVWATKTLTATVRAVDGKVRYKGTPQVTRRIEANGGTVLPVGK